jgi:putative isomerase
MMAWLVVAVTVLLVAPVVRAAADGGAASIFDWPNVLSLRATNESSAVGDETLLSDAGSWHGIALPDPNITSTAAPGLSGPYLHGEGYGWLSSALAGLTLLDPSNGGAPVQWTADSANTNFFPGYATAAWTAAAAAAAESGATAATMAVESVFVSNRTNLIRFNITTANGAALDGFLTGSLLPPLGAGLQATAENVLTAALSQSQPVAGGSVQLACDRTVAVGPIDVAAGGLSYRWPVQSPSSSSSSASWSLVCTQSFYFSAFEQMNEQSLIAAVLSGGADGFIASARARWERWLSAVVQPSSQSAAEQRLAVKSLLTLAHNWRSPLDGGHLSYDSLWPSYAGYLGFWNWDSMKVPGTWRVALGGG